MCGISGANLSSWLGSSSLGHCTMGNFCFWSSWPSPTVHLSIPMSCQQSGHLDVSALAQGLVTYSDLWLTIFSQFLHCTVQLLSYLLQFNTKQHQSFAGRFSSGEVWQNLRSLPTLPCVEKVIFRLKADIWIILISLVMLILRCSWFDLYWEIFVTVILQ